VTVLYSGIGELVTNDPSQGDGTALGIIEDAALVVDGDRIAWIGQRTHAPDADQSVDFGESSVIPGFVDSPMPRVASPRLSLRRGPLTTRPSRAGSSGWPTS
jgi:hypothetical protein